MRLIRTVQHGQPPLSPRLDCLPDRVPLLLGERHGNVVVHSNLLVLRFRCVWAGSGHDVDGKWTSGGSDRFPFPIPVGNGHLIVVAIILTNP
ncbi:hypothetical protein KUTG_03814 [Kutzneria sp. 744]|nr:hypothetical protein KUTG_03814 [Kutzneria sp. 744]